MKYSISAVTDVGMVRVANEDMFLVASDEVFIGCGERVEHSREGAGNFLVAVADGFGGGLAGEFGARQALESVKSLLLNGNQAEPLLDLVQSSLAKANEEIRKQIGNKPEICGAGATLGLVVRRGDEICLSDVGDSFIVLFRDDQCMKVFRQVHGWKHLWTPTSPDDFPKRPSIEIFPYISGLGSVVKVDASIAYFKARPGDAVLLGSDGLLQKLTLEGISQILRGENTSRITTELVQAALEQGGEDNITCVLCRFPEAEMPSAKPVPLKSDLEIIQNQYPQNSEVGHFLTESFQWFVRQGQFENAREIASSVPEDVHRDYLLSLLAEAEDR